MSLHYGPRVAVITFPPEFGTISGTWEVAINSLDWEVELGGPGLSVVLNGQLLNKKSGSVEREVKDVMQL